MTVGWQYHDFVRLACVGPTRAEALEALRTRIDKLRDAGYAIPPDSLVTLRSAPGGATAPGSATAELTLPERVRQPGGSFLLRRWRETPKRRHYSGTQPKLIVGETDDEKTG